LLANGMSAAI
jgi:hypothetical protein